ncbi:YpdA family putative bacillithiol disulfide reductase [Flavobacterium quisquiliarum]|jgi:thioredoxin reductase (NADPH)|uniref:YpdA family putative bacillithiol disulfide reductase n=1 Tax=Flavobacterium quisquiliarum TaxID=1834436 RepID=A0ABV8W5R5_9FLAO|nr:YpdA family putative bacillithiol disulfide reductase [Flavobacterium quisquiliarum]MBW1658358.1 YpdA family putative bacillithiol disulfide reductase [Flavobacterium quisquiliarum]NWL02307.1 YpdA family putative bacillithiol disulfide reductase [Flavobacterium collinsii]
MTEAIYDLIIIGGGPIGLACAIEAEKKNLKYLIIEKGAIVNSIFNYPLYMTFFSTAERLEIGDIPFNCLAPKPGRQEALEYYRNIHRYFKFNINLFEKVIDVQKDSNGSFHVKTDKQEYLSKNVIIATGFYDIPIEMNVLGENLPKVRHYYKEAHEYAFRKVLVVGANNSSVDAALECWRKGAEVTMVIRKNEINSRVKYWVKPDIENRIEEGSIKAYFQSNITEIRENEVEIETPNGKITIENDFVLALTGYKPDLNFLEKMGIQLSDDELKIPVYNSETMETNVEGLFLAGVVCGGMQTHKWFIENSRIHASMIVDYITSK